MRTTLLPVTLLAVLLAFVPLFFAASTGGAEGRAPARQQLVDGKSVVWWAKRARANGAAVRWQKKRVAKLQRAWRDRVEVGPYGVAGGFLCIHPHEGAWNSNTGNGYYGGLQMDLEFQRTYGWEFYDRIGTADKWPPFVQVAVAMRAYYSGRGFHPWPNTARMCGLL